jgi:hypothetical protein
MLGAMFCFTEALPSLAVLWRSHAVNALPMSTNRVLVALLMGLSLATLVGAVAVIARSVRLGNSSQPAVDS